MIFMVLALTLFWHSRAYASLKRIDKSMTITDDGSHCIVLRLTDFVLNGKDTLTLSGTATSAFIINVSNQFSLTDNSKIVLSGGVLASNVLKVRGSKGGYVTLDKQSGLMGILMANQRSVDIKDNASVRGEVIANSINLSANARITSPSVVSP